MYDLIIFAIGFAMMTGVGYAGYMAGREKAESAAWFTISELRREIRICRLEADRLQQRMNGIPKGDAHRVTNFRAGL